MSIDSFQKLFPPLSMLTYGVNCARHKCLPNLSLHVYDKLSFKSHINYVCSAVSEISTAFVTTQILLEQISATAFL